VRGVEDDSPAARAGVRVGDLIIEANGRPVTSSDDLFAVLDGLAAGSGPAAPGRASLSLRIVRGVDRLDVAVTFGSTGEEGSA
jgi:putative serine protease PepD